MIISLPYLNPSHLPKCFNNVLMYHMVSCKWDNLKLINLFEYVLLLVLLRCFLIENCHILSVTNSNIFVEKYYGNLPNEGAGCSSKSISDYTGRNLRFWDFQWLFRVENRTSPYSSDVLQTIGASLLGEAPLIGRIQ